MVDELDIITSFRDRRFKFSQPYLERHNLWKTSHKRLANPVQECLYEMNGITIYYFRYHSNGGRIVKSVFEPVGSRRLSEVGLANKINRKTVSDLTFELKVPVPTPKSNVLD